MICSGVWRFNTLDCAAGESVALQPIGAEHCTYRKAALHLRRVSPLRVRGCGDGAALARRHVRASWLSNSTGTVTSWAPSTCRIGSAEFALPAGEFEFIAKPTLQISVQIWNLWFLEALCSAAVT
jgi:hypothetical protein